MIPFNPFPGTQYQRSDAATIERFQTVLMQAGYVTTIRRTRGDDIDAACGQLAGQVKDKTKRHLRNVPVVTQHLAGRSDLTIVERHQ